MIRRLAFAAAVSMAAAPVSAQSLASRIAAAGDGTIGMHFTARPGVCASEDGGIQFLRGRDADYSYSYRRGPCLVGPVVVTLSKSKSEVESLRTRVAVRAPNITTDLGEVSGSEASTYLASLARHIGGRSGSEALTAGALADGFDVWPDFRRVVLDADAPMQSREQALFWIGQSETPTSNLTALYAELEPRQLREHYTFVLSQRHDDDQAVDKLIDVARSDRDSGVRKQAMFWLGQSHTAKAAKFFRDVLTP